MRTATVLVSLSTAAVSYGSDYTMCSNGESASESCRYSECVLTCDANEELCPEPEMCADGTLPNMLEDCVPQCDCDAPSEEDLNLYGPDEDQSPEDDQAPEVEDDTDGPDEEQSPEENEQDSNCGDQASTEHGQASISYGDDQAAISYGDDQAATENDQKLKNDAYSTSFVHSVPKGSDKGSHLIKGIDDSSSAKANTNLRGSAPSSASTATVSTLAVLTALVFFC